MDNLQLIEPVPIDDDLCTGLAMIEDLGHAARFVLYARQTCYESGATVFVVKRKLVVPIEAIGPGVDMTLRFLARREPGATGRRLLRLVR
jgi:hypothetical protein